MNADQILKMKINMIVKFSRLKSSSCPLRLPGQELIKRCGGVTKHKTRRRPLRCRKNVGQRGRPRGSSAPASRAVSATHAKFLLGQEEGDAAAASVTRDVGLLAPSGRQGPDIRGTALWGETQGLRGGGHG